MSERGWPSPREWVGESAFPWPATSVLADGDSIVACFTVLDTSLVRTPAGTTFLEIELADATGSTTGWLPAMADVEWIRAGLYVGVRGTVEGGDAWLRVRIAEISPLQVGLDDLALFLPRSPADPAVLEQQLGDLVDSIADTGLHQLVSLLLGAGEDVGRGFRMAPAATRNHHAYLGGLFEHTVSVALLCDRLASHYAYAVDRDLLVAAALLHDIGKIREIGARAGFPYTDEGRLLGHIVLGLQMVGEAARSVSLDADRRLLLEHLIASHQGRYEWQSPREPRVLEAIILHYVDDLDAKANHAIALLDGVDGGWTGYDRTLGRELLRHRPAMPVAAARPRTPAGKPGSHGRKPAADSRKSRPGSDRAAGASAKQKTERPDRSGGGRAAGKKKAPTGGRGSRKTRREKHKKSGPPATQAPPPGPGPPGFVDLDTLDLFE